MGTKWKIFTYYIRLHIDVLFQVRVRICPNGKVNRARSPFSPINKLEDDQNDNR